MNRANSLSLRFGILDVLVFAGMTALGIFVSQLDPKYLESILGLGDTQARWENRPFIARQLEALANKPLLVRLRYKALDVAAIILPFATLGAAITTFRHRAYRTRHALRHIGVLTSAVTGLLVFALLLNEYVLRRFKMLEVGYTHREFGWSWYPADASVTLSVIALWVVLALGHRWRTAPGGFDLLGRLLGVSWVAYGIGNELP